LGARKLPKNDAIPAPGGVLEARAAKGGLLDFPGRPGGQVWETVDRNL